jgi:hypothetical protein
MVLWTPLFWEKWGGFNLPWGGSKYNDKKLTPGSKYHMENWTRGQNIIGKSTPGSIYHGVQNTIRHLSGNFPAQISKWYFCVFCCPTKQSDYNYVSSFLPMTDKSWRGRSEETSLWGGHMRVTLCHVHTGADPARAPPPPKLEKIWFVGVISRFFTRNTQNNFVPPSARRNFFKYSPP